MQNSNFSIMRTGYQIHTDSKKGIPTKETNIVLSTSITSNYNEWENKNNSIFSTLNKHITQMVEVIELNREYHIMSKDIKDFYINAPAHLIHKKVIYVTCEINKDRVFTQLHHNQGIYYQL